MSDTIPAQSTDKPPAQSLPARALGVIFAPRATYANVAAHPRVLGAILTVVLIVGAASAALLSTEVGKTAALNQALDMAESFGAQVNDQMMQRIESQLQYSVYTSIAGPLVFVPLVAALVAGLILAVFNAILGGDATFKQAMAIVSHSYFVVALQTLFSTPLNYVRESFSSATSLAVFLPMLDEASFLGRLTGSIDLFRIWWIVSLAIGLGVLYKRKTAPIAWGMLLVYFFIVLVIAGVRTALSGA